MSAIRYYLLLDLEEGFDSIRWVRGIRGLNTGDTDRWAHGQAMLAHRRLYMQHDSAGSWAGLRLQKFHSVRGSGCKLARDLRICRDRAKKRMTRSRRWGCAARLYRENVPDLTMDVDWRGSGKKQQEE
jgi:hypothetical protein